MPPFLPSEGKFSRYFDDNLGLHMTSGVTTEQSLQSDKKKTNKGMLNKTTEKKNYEDF